jgi:CHAD domain-containing protein
VRVSFELESGEGVEAGIRRIVDEQLESALEELRLEDRRKVDEAVHSARKRLKRVRAVARLVRGELGNEVFQRENVAMRDAGRTLSEARDAAVLVQTLEGLKGRVEPAAFGAARKALVARRRAIHQRVIEQGHGLEGVSKTVDEARDRVSKWQIDCDGWKALRPGLRRIYADGREAFKLAGQGAHEEVFHEWRKQVKHLWHQLEVIEPVWPAVIKALGDECHELADLLGKEHDLAVLREVLEKESLVGPEEAASVAEAVEESRTGLQQQALFLGRRVFAEKPKPFVRRMGKYWRAWQAQAAAKPKEEATEDQPVPPAAVVADATTGQGGGAGNGQSGDSIGSGLTAVEAAAAGSQNGAA